MRCLKGPINKRSNRFLGAKLKPSVYFEIAISLINLIRQMNFDENRVDLKTKVKLINLSSPKSESLLVSHAASGQQRKGLRFGSNVMMRAFCRAY